MQHCLIALNVQGTYTSSVFAEFVLLDERGR